VAERINNKISIMQTATEYLTKTESAVRHLFRGIDSYLKPLRLTDIPVFVTSEPFGAAQQAEYSTWEVENAGRLAARKQVEEEFIADAFALDILTGAILQVAEKALDLYCKEVAIPPEWSSTVKPSMAKYCRGRLVRTVPLGLVIYAARNQHVHFDDRPLREPSAVVFERLATAHGYPSSESFRDPAFDLSNSSLTSFASNITGLVKWRTYDQYVNDMRALLEIKPSIEETFSNET
jgi:hypothetical protein